MKNFLFVGALLSMPIVAFAVGQYWLGIVFVIFYIIFGVVEIVAKNVSGKTVSQHFWIVPIWKAWLVVGSMIVGWTALIFHLLRLL